MGLRTVLGLKKIKLPPFLNESYSQEGEDCILGRIFEGKKDGFFVDVGAHQPIQYSNSYKFYKLGWNGINIDAWPGSMEAFNLVRPLDKNIEVAVSDTEEIIPFYLMTDPALNTFSLENAMEYSKKPIYKIEKTVELKTKTLKQILDENMPEGRQIDFLSIDAEGFDFKVLLSNDWVKYQPTVILIENESSLIDFIDSEIYQFMLTHDYQFFAKTVKTMFFKKTGFVV